MFISVGRYRSITMMMMMMGMEMMMSIQTNHAKKFSEKKRFRKAEPGSAFITGSSLKLLLQLVQEYFRKYT